MSINNNEIADIFSRYADLLEIEDANPFRVRAYRNAARFISDYPKSMAALLSTGENLDELPTIGKDLASRIRTIVETGTLPELESTRAKTPATLVELLQIEGLGPKRVRTLHCELGISNIDDLKRALRRGSIRALRGFGVKTEQRIREALAEIGGMQQRIPLIRAEAAAKPLLDYLAANPATQQVTIAGSYRRRRETVGDLDILVTAESEKNITGYLSAYEDIEEILALGQTRARLRLRSRIIVDLRVVPPSSYGAALNYFTGSRNHAIAMRKRAIARGLKLNEYGLFKGDRPIAGDTEKDLYGALSLPYIEPELRENTGELEAAEQHKLPHLVALKDIRGDLHCHTNASDGHDSVQELANAARKKGYEYLSINDHSQRVTVAHGLDKKRLLDQIRSIDKLNEKLDGITLLKSTEVDILEDGSLDLPDAVLRELDFTVCAIHSKFHLPEVKQTERILRAMDNRCFNILAHPHGRLINRRRPYLINLEVVMRGALERGCYLEVNAHPERLDLNGEGCRLARDLRLKVAISTDSHRIADLEYMRFGLDQARRGWLEKQDVLNTRPLEELRQLLARH